MGAKGGYAPKDSPITDNFNQLKKGGLSQRELKHLEQVAKVGKVKIKAEAKRGEKRLLKITEEAEALKERLGIEEIDTVSSPPPPADSKHEAEDEKSAYEMLQDMRWVYKKVKGREKLRDLIEGDDKEFKFMVKELLKIEASLLTAKIRSKDDPTAPANQMVFVVLKGLEDEKKITSQMDKGKGAIDMKQITHAINPDGSEYEEDVGKW